MTKAILVTGATGFLSRHLLQSLEEVKNGFHAIALVRNISAWKKYDWAKDLKKVEPIEGSILEPSLFEGDLSLKDLSAMIHLAALVRHSRRNSEEIYETNVKGTLNMVRLAAQHKSRMIFVSTSGTVACFPKEQMMANEKSPYVEKEVARWPYYHSKILAEKEAKRLAQELGVELIIVRPPVMLGPGDHRGRSTHLIVRFLKGQIPFLIKGGIHFTDIRDVAKALIQILTLSKPHSVYHLCGTAVSLKHFFEMLEKVSGKKAPRFCLHPKMAFILSKLSAQLEFFLPSLRGKLLPDPVLVEMASKYWGMRSLYSASDLGFESRDPYETLADTVKWIQERQT